MASASSSPTFQVFITHAGEDKDTIAIPLRDRLNEKGFKTFVDMRDIPAGCSSVSAMTAAMDQVKVAIIILSPELIAKKWPMKELLFFLTRRRVAPVIGRPPVDILPVFYRLAVADMYSEPDLTRMTSDGESLYQKTRFFERMNNKEPEADLRLIKNALQSVHGIQGVENDYYATNDASAEPSRLLLLHDIIEKVSRIMDRHADAS